MNLQKLLIYIIFQVTMVTVTVQQCPITVCSCEQYPPNIRVINCRDKSLTRIPKIDFPSTKYAYKLTFSTSQDVSSEYCYTCNKIASLTDDVFQGIRVTSLDLSKNRIQFVSNGAFNGLEQHLTELFMSGDDVSKPPYFAITNLTLLETMELDNFYQKYMDETNNFGRFPNLRKLVLKNMKISYIASLSFANRLKNLRHLELSGHVDLKILPVGALRYLSSLTHLFLTRNNIKTIPYGAFSKLVLIQELDLSENGISRLESGCFKNIQNTLETLKLHLNNLDENKLHALKEGHWGRLKELNLAHNQLQRIPEGLFVNMIELKYVYLNSNNLVSIQRYDFEALSNLREIDLTSNQLLYVQPNSFVDLRSLKFLDLRGQNEWNKYLKLNITREAVYGLENVLEELLLSRTEVEETTVWDAVKVLKHLKILQLGNTGLTSIRDYTFKDHSDLQYLDLSENRIFELDSKKFLGLKDSLLTLDISQNSIRLIDECVLKDFSKLNQIYLWQNPLHCDCRLTWLYEWIEVKKQHDPFIIYTADPVCDTPSNLHRYPLYQLKRDDLKCHQNYTKLLCIVPAPTIIPTTIPTTVTTTSNTSTGLVTDPVLDVKIDKRENTRIKLVWNVSTVIGIQNFKLSIQKDDGNSMKMIFALDKTIDYFILSKLETDSYYEICVHVLLTHLRTPGPKKCLFTKTLPTSDGKCNIFNVYCIVLAIIFGFLFKLS